MSMMLMVEALHLKVGNPLRKLVLIKLADNANDQGECWPSYRHIADQCEIGHSTVRKHIKELEKAGLVEVAHRRTEKGDTSNMYRLTLSKGVPPDSRGVPPDSRGGATREQGGCHQIAPESVNESVNETTTTSETPKFEKIPQNLKEHCRYIPPDQQQYEYEQFCLHNHGKQLRPAQTLKQWRNWDTQYNNRERARPGRQKAAKPRVTKGANGNRQLAVNGYEIEY